MKIGYCGLDLPEGKVRYTDGYLDALVQKDKPKKVSPFYVEFIPDDFSTTRAIVVPRQDILDLLILDMEKIETRLERTTNDGEQLLLLKCLEDLERDIPLCDIPLTDEEKKIVTLADPLSLKPVVQVNGDEDLDTVIAMVLDKAAYTFFYTSGPQESHAWLVKKQSDIITCASKIHTDLARGFIKGDVVGFDDYIQRHSFNECKLMGTAKLVDRDYVVQERDIIEIRFNTRS